MIDFGFDKIALIGAVALIAIGPKKLPRVARTIGHLVGRAQRYVANVRAEVNRSIELEELQAMKAEFENAARDVEQTVSNEINEATADLNASWNPEGPPLGSDLHEGLYPSPQHTHPRKRWRLKRSALPQWYKQRHRVRSHALSGAARVARFRPQRKS